MAPKKVLVALPPGLLEQIDFVAQVEHRTRSDLIRESLRRYMESFKQSNTPRSVVPGAPGTDVTGNVFDMRKPSP